MLLLAPAVLRLGLATAFGLALAAQQGVVPAKVGELVPDFEFPQLRNGDGRQSLADFAGQPVLIVFWSQLRDLAVMARGLDEAIAADRRLRGKGVISLFLEASKASTDDAEALLWQKCLCFDGRVAGADLAMPLPGIEDPSVMLIGVDGRLLLVEKLERWYGDQNPVLQGELAKMSNGWGDNEAVAKVRAALYGKGLFAAARTLAGDVPDDKSRERVLAEIDAVFARRIAAIEWLTQAGSLVTAKTAADALQKGAAGANDLQARVAPLLAALTADPAKKGMAVDQKLDKLLGKVRAQQFRGDLRRELDALAKDAKDTAVAPRIGRLTALLEWRTQAGRR